MFFFYLMFFYYLKSVENDENVLLNFKKGKEETKL
jgi:hypothetical protein